MSFWSLGEDAFETTDQIFHGKDPGIVSAPDPEVRAAFDTLRALVVRRTEALTDEDWEWLVVDYLKAQGAHVDERHVGGSRAIIDVEARFDHGELGDEIWRVQVKRLKSQKVDWSAIDHDHRHVGDARFCYVSVFGFTDEARRNAAAKDVVLLEAGDFTRFVLTGKLRARLQAKLRLPAVGRGT